MANIDPLLAGYEEQEGISDEALGISYVGDLRDWFIEPSVLQKARKLHARGQNVTFFNFSGPAIKAVWWVTITQWGFALLFPFFVVHVSSCPKPWEPFAHYPSWVLVPFFLVILISLRQEYMALRWTLCTVLQHCTPFKVMGFKPSFKLWLAFISVQSLTSHFDLATNGLFLANIMKTVGCQGGEAEKISVIWKKTIEAAPYAPRIPGFGDLERITLGGFLLMFLQPMFGFAFAWPLQWSRVDYGPESMKDGYVTLWSKWFYPRFGRHNQRVLHHADALQALASVNRMVSLTDKSLRWCLCRGEDIMHGDGANKHALALGQVPKELARITLRFVLVNVLEKAYMLEVQVSIFCISRCLMPRDQPWWARYDGQMLFSLCLSGATFMKVLYDSTEQLSSVFAFSNSVVDDLQSHPEVMEEEGQKRRVEAARIRLSCCKFGFSLGISGLFWILLHSLSKFVMAFVCEDSLWNMRDPFSNPPPGLDWKGCVELSTYLGER